MTDKVIYASIPNFSRYIVSNDGNLFRLMKDGKKRQLANYPNHYGYICNFIKSDSGDLKYMQRGFLVLTAFANSSYFDGAETDHINHNTQDNRLENLRWLSHKDNCRNRRYTKPEKSRELYLIFDDGSV